MAIRLVVPDPPIKPAVVTKVLFLDVDGPMIPRRCYPLGQLPGEGGSMKRMDPVAVSVVVRICSLAKARIVVSSSWRIWGREKCLAAFRENGIYHTLVHEDWATSHNLPGGADRSTEIKDWLARHPEVTTFAVLEDGLLDVPNLIHVTFEDGLLYEHQLRLAELLGVEVAHD